MFSKLIKRKNKSKGDITANPLPVIPTYKNLDFHSILESNSFFCFGEQAISSVDGDDMVTPIR